jgi:hypothetical protein
VFETTLYILQESRLVKHTHLPLWVHKLLKCYIWSIALYGAETGTFRAVGQKKLESFEMWCWRRMEKISWTDRLRNEEVILKIQGTEEYPTRNK